MLDEKATAQALAVMATKFPKVGSSLVADSDFHFLLAVILSAQTTDAAVNRVTPALFAAYPQPENLMQAQPIEVEKYISTLGLYHNKARYLVACARDLVNNFASQVPRNHRDLQSLAGVGRKTADVVLAERFHIPALAVDTHVERVSKRLAMVAMDASVLQTEKVLMTKIPKKEWIHAHHLFITWGRQVCTARNPACANCPLLTMCQEGHRRMNGVNI